MKKLKTALILFLLLISLSLIACGECEHTDANGDYICDKCFSELKAPPKPTPDNGGDDENDYRITSVTIGGESIEGKCILINSSDERFDAVLLDAARRIKTYIKDYAGIDMPIIQSESDGEAAFKLSSVPRGAAGAKGFTVKRVGTSIEISGAHHNKFTEAFTAYYNKTFKLAREKEMKLSDFESKINTAVVYYDDFGAAGDGKTDDYAAIKAAHDFANEGGQTVKANGTKSYLLRDVTERIAVRTDTDFCGAKIIIDSRHITPENDGIIYIIESHIKSDFIPKAQLAALPVSEDGLVLSGMNSQSPTEKLPFSFGYTAMVHLKNADKRNYIRYGYVDNTGAEQNEVVLIDADGNIDPSTPLLHDFEKLTSAVAYRCDEESVPTLYFKNVTFETRPSLINIYGKSSTYLNRGITVTRANTVIENLTHTIVGEYDKHTPVYEDENGFSQIAAGYRYENGKIIDSAGKAYTGNDIKPFMGYNYNGIVRALYAQNLKFKSCIFRARKNYFGGTYDIGATYSNKVVFEDCTQSNFFEKDKDGKNTTVPNLSVCWGIAGTNYCKNLEYIRSRLTRYDAHAGVVNGKIEDSEIGVLRLIGGGEFVIENTTVYARSSAPFQLRDDYGSSFSGTLTIKDCRIIDGWGSGTTVKSLISVHKANMDTGYTCYFPNIVIDNLDIDTTNKDVELVAYAYRTYDKDGSHYPTRDVFTQDVHDPEALFDYFYETRNPDCFKTHPYFSAFLDKTDTVDNGDGTYTLIIHKIKNQSVYIPPEFIEIKNNEGKNYRLTLYNCKFFENTEIRAGGTSLARIDFK